MGGWRAYSFICTVLLHLSQTVLPILPQFISWWQPRNCWWNLHRPVHCYSGSEAARKKTIICTFLSGENQTLSLALKINKALQLNLHSFTSLLSTRYNFFFHSPNSDQISWFLVLKRTSSVHLKHCNPFPDTARE